MHWLLFLVLAQPLPHDGVRAVELTREQFPSESACRLEMAALVRARAGALKVLRQDCLPEIAQ